MPPKTARNGGDFVKFLSVRALRYTRQTKNVAVKSNNAGFTTTLENEIAATNAVAIYQNRHGCQWLSNMNSKNKYRIDLLYRIEFGITAMVCCPTAYFSLRSLNATVQAGCIGYGCRAHTSLLRFVCKRMIAQEMEFVNTFLCKFNNFLIVSIWYYQLYCTVMLKSSVSTINRCIYTLPFGLWNQHFKRAIPHPKLGYRLVRQAQGLYFCE